MSLNSTELLHSLVATRIISAAEAERLADSSATEIAESLAAGGSLNRFQADRIRHGEELFIGDYLLQARIGQGGMGAIYEAWHPHLERAVVMKSVAPHLPGNEELRERFQRELRICGQLNHPNIVTVHDAVIHEGVPWLVMEKLEGQDLNLLISLQGPLPSATVTQIAVEAARGLQHAHGRGILHRDVKPSNLFLVDGNGIRVLDFGLAMARQLADPAQQQLTESGVTLGTAAFMSPEQGSGSHRVDERSDIYSLGCTLYYLLTGRTPYGGKTTLEQLLAHRDSPRPDLKEIECGPVFRSAVRRMIAKDPRDRQQTMNEVIDDFRVLAAGDDSTLSLPTPSLETLPTLDPLASIQSAARRRSVRWKIAAATSIVALVGGLALVGRQLEDDRATVPGASSGAEETLTGWPLIATRLESANPGLDIPAEAYSVVDQRAVLDLAGLEQLERLVDLGTLPVDELYINGTSISDLAPLGSAALREIDLGETSVIDLSPLAGTSLENVALYQTSVRDLQPLRDAPLWRIDIHESSVHDLRPLAGIQLEEIDLHGTAVKDLSPLAAAPLKWLDCQRTSVTSLEPLKNCPLERLWCDPRLLEGVDLRATWPTLSLVNDTRVTNTRQE